VFIYILSYAEPLLHEVREGLRVRFIPLEAWLKPIDSLLFRLRKVPYVAAVRDRIAYHAYGDGFTRALATDRIDVLYHQEVWTPRFDLMLRKVPLPMVGADHGAVYSDWMAAGKRRALAKAALVICQSHTGVQLAKELGGNAELMYNGVNVEFFMPGAAAERQAFILAVGRFVEPQKRFADLLRAVRLLTRFRLVLVGSGPDEALLKQLAADQGVQDRVQFTGFMSSREQLRGLYQQCGVFVSTSSWEAVALVMLEAMSCGAAVVASRIPSFEELLTDQKDGLLFPVGDVPALVESIKQAWERRSGLGAAARDTVAKHYSSAALYKRLSDSIERLP